MTNRIIINGETELSVLYAGVSSLTGEFKTQIYFGENTLGQLAMILDGAQTIELLGGDNEQVIEGYSRLTEIKFVDGETALAVLEKED